MDQESGYEMAAEQSVYSCARQNPLWGCPLSGNCPAVSVERAGRSGPVCRAAAGRLGGDGAFSVPKPLHAGEEFTQVKEEASGVERAINLRP